MTLLGRADGVIDGVEDLRDATLFGRRRNANPHGAEGFGLESARAVAGFIHAPQNVVR